MSFKDLDIKSCYESGIGDIVQDFYEPVLASAILYDRIAGFFTSTSLAVAARGMAQFIQNGGIMRLITSPILSSEDMSIIQKVVDNSEDISALDLGLNLEQLENALLCDHVKALGWLLSQGRLEIKLAVVVDAKGNPLTKENLFSIGLFHQKVGILTDAEGNHISFSGSINETASAWTHNDEEFKVFKDWEDSADYYKNDREKFDEIWAGSKYNITLIPLPKAVREELIAFSKDFEIDSISAKKYIERKRAVKSPFELNGISLFYYQKDALAKWRESGFSMLFEMATGTGKTRTAIAGMNYIMHQHERVITIISCPQNTLAKQWKGEVEKLGIVADETDVVDGTHNNWRNALTTICLQNRIGLANKCILYTTHDTASSPDFISIIQENVGANSKVLFIGDEVHWLGARKLRAALMERYDYRIGLSATPSRWFDDSGTKIIDNYFGNVHFEFTLKNALAEINPLTGKHFLVDYYYNIHRVSLTDDEGIEYANLTDRISKLYRVKDTDDDAAELYERLIEKRANIVKNAENKYPVLESILDELTAKDELENLIIFVSPQQKEHVVEILNKKDILFHQLTQEEGTTPKSQYGGKTERQYIIQKFVEKRYQALVAIKCLDEGIDIPTAARGILMASSTNPREYVQRIGRIIRQEASKSYAYLYDICVESSGCFVDDGMRDIDAKIRQKELARLNEIAALAINSADALKNIFALN